MTLPTCTPNELMRRQYARLNEARALAESELLIIKDIPAEDREKAIAHNDLIRAKVDGIADALDLIIQTWKEYLGC